MLPALVALFLVVVAGSFSTRQALARRTLRLSAKRSREFFSSSEPFCANGCILPANGLKSFAADRQGSDTRGQCAEDGCCALACDKRDRSTACWYPSTEAILLAELVQERCPNSEIAGERPNVNLNTSRSVSANALRIESLSRGLFNSRSVAGLAKPPRVALPLAALRRIVPPPAIVQASVDHNPASCRR